MWEIQWSNSKRCFHSQVFLPFSSLLPQEYHPTSGGKLNSTTTGPTWLKSFLLLLSRQVHGQKIEEQSFIPLSFPQHKLPTCIIIPHESQPWESTFPGSNEMAPEGCRKNPHFSLDPTTVEIFQIQPEELCCLKMRETIQHHTNVAMSLPASARSYVNVLVQCSRTHPKSCG